MSVFDAVTETLTRVSTVMALAIAMAVLLKHDEGLMALALGLIMFSLTMGWLREWLTKRYEARS